MIPFETIAKAMAWAILGVSGPFCCLIRHYRVEVRRKDNRWTITDRGSMWE